MFVIFSDRINLIVGKNAQGKTNLAEANHFLCYLASFRTHSLEHLLTMGETAAQVQGSVIRNDFTQKARVEITRRGRRAWLDDATVATLSSYISQFYSLLFNPDNLYRYRHNPGERRPR